MRCRGEDPINEVYVDGNVMARGHRVGHQKTIRRDRVQFCISYLLYKIRQHHTLLQSICHISIHCGCRHRLRHFSYGKQRTKLLQYYGNTSLFERHLKCAHHPPQNNADTNSEPLLCSALHPCSSPTPVPPHI